MAGQNAMHLAAQHSQDCLAVLLFGPLRWFLVFSYFTYCCCCAHMCENWEKILAVLCWTPSSSAQPRCLTVLLFGSGVSIILGHPHFRSPCLHPMSYFRDCDNCGTVLAVLCSTPGSSAKPMLTCSVLLSSTLFAEVVVGVVSAVVDCIVNIHVVDIALPSLLLTHDLG